MPLSSQNETNSSICVASLVITVSHLNWHNLDNVNALSRNSDSIASSGWNDAVIDIG